MPAADSESDTVVKRFIFLLTTQEDAISGFCLECFHNESYWTSCTVFLTIYLRGEGVGMATLINMPQSEG